jgi:hypothetical protein
LDFLTELGPRLTGLTSLELEWDGTDPLAPLAALPALSNLRVYTNEGLGSESDIVEDNLDDLFTCGLTSLQRLEVDICDFQWQSLVQVCSMAFPSPALSKIHPPTTIFYQGLSPISMTVFTEMYDSGRSCQPS